MASVKSGTSLDKPQGPALGEVDTLECVYCRASVYYVGLPATRYVEHLCKLYHKFLCLNLKNNLDLSQAAN